MPKIVDHEERRREVSIAVLDVVAEHGVSGLTLDLVAAQSGWSRGVLSHYFGHKAELLEAGLREGMRMSAARLGQAAVESSARDAVCLMLEEALPLDARRRAFGRVLAAFKAEALATDSLQNYFVHNNRFWRDTVTAAVKRGQAQGEIAEDVDASFVAEMLTMAADGLQSYALFSPDLDPHLQRSKAVAWVEALLPRP